MKERLKQLRKTLDLTQQEFAERLGVKRNTVGQWECGINALTEQVIISICREFDVNEEWLRTGEGNMFTEENFYPQLKGRIKAVRKVNKMTQIEFGQKIGIKGNTVTNYETGLRNPSDAIIKSICREFNTNEHWLRTGEGEMFNNLISSDLPLNSDICERFLKIRISLNMKQCDFAKEIKTTQGHVSDIENKRKSVSDRIIEILRLKFNINETWLRTGEGEMFSEPFGNSNMSERLKILRKELGMTQQEFADKLGIARGNIGAYEVGKNALSDAVISLICREFNVNKNWLRTGTGEMFTHQTDDEQLTSFIVKILANKSTSFKRKFISMLSALDESDWDVLEKMVTLLKKED